MSRAILLGYDVVDRSPLEIDFLRELTRPDDVIFFPDGTHKIGFTPERFAALSAPLAQETHLVTKAELVDRLEPFGSIIRFSSNATNHLHKTPLKDRLSYVESYGGFDHPNIKVAHSFPKSAFSRQFLTPWWSQRTGRVHPIGPMWYPKRGAVEMPEQLTVGLYFKNVYFVEKKAQQWFGRRRGTVYGQRHRALVRNCIQALSKYRVIACLHPNHGGFRDEEIAFFEESGLPRGDILTEGDNYTHISLGVGFSTHSRADCNWYGKPFIELDIPDLPKLRAWNKARNCRSITRDIERKVPGLAQSHYLPFYYGRGTALEGLAETVDQVMDTYNEQNCLAVGEALLGPSMNNAERAHVVNTALGA